MATIKIDFMRPKHVLDCPCLQGGVMNRLERMLEFKHIKRLPTLSTEDSTVFPGQGSTLIIDCDEEDRSTIFAFYLGIDFMRGNVHLVHNCKDYI